MDLRLKFNEDVLNYDRWRPTYGTKIFDDIINYSKINSTKKALEIGIGTGQATLSILQTGCKVTAVELGNNLAEYVKQKFMTFSNFEVKNVDFESFISGQNQYDIIYSATAFHWIPQDLGLTKAHGLLKPGGTIALFWNHPFVNRKNDPIHEEIRKAYNKYMPSDENPIEFDGSTCKRYEDNLLAYDFIDVTTKLYKNVRTLTSQNYISLLNTYSDHRALPYSIKKGLEGEIEEGIEKFGGKITIYDTVDLYLAKKPLLVF
ncbi:class I SAM-dependent methyltransferase [Lutispora saccharofermentans]|uniref:Class I SAM-dependent methyltransferase n=1 Tax=Lutispora saccharofermentans TaxID=3024236 RepID=A0ABT1NGY2_9FIRM|nr:class I SAM-dependent methyltransferase [Lutispora saccharofermentans]MCQ1530482.1 class I SAM-dependent methyltransferase [Lutispora saccharofermentans]